MANELIRLQLSDSGATAALGIQLTDAEIAAKLTTGAIALAIKGSTSIGGVASDRSGNLYITDSAQHIVLKVTQAGTITTMAGWRGTSGDNAALMNVAATDARFNTPLGIDVDNSGNVYVADQGNNQIRKITQSGLVSVVAGNGLTTAGFADGAGALATFNGPTDVAVDASGVIWVCDQGNHSIRQIKGSSVITFAGSESGDGENTATTTRGLFSSPRAIAVNRKQEVFVADTGNMKIKKIIPRGHVYLHSGSGSPGRNLGTFSASTYNEIWSLAVDNSDRLYVIDASEDGDSRLIRVDINGLPSVIADFWTSTNGEQIAGISVDPSQKLFVVVSGVTSSAYSSSSSSSLDVVTSSSSSTSTT